MTSYSNDEVEQLRVSLRAITHRYRQQALKAVEEAKQQAFKEGQEQAQQQIDAALQTLRKENATLRAVLEAYKQSESSSDDDESRGLRVLLRYIMEQIYGDVKKSIDKNDTLTGEQVINTMKSILVSRADSMAQTIGDLPNILTAAKASNNTTTQQQQQQQEQEQQPQQQLSLQKPAAESLTEIINPALAIFNEYRSQPALDIAIAIKGIEKHDTGVFGNFATYEIQSAVLPVPSTSKRPIYYACSHRYRDFDALCAQLKKVIPQVILPSLPPKDISVGNNLRDDFVQARRRGLRLWMQHISAHPELQRCPIVAQFLCGGRIPQSWPVDPSLVTVKSVRTIRFSLQRKRSSRGVFREEPNDVVVEASGPVQSESDRERANRLVTTVSKDFAAMQQPFKATIEAAGKLINCMQEQVTARQELYTALCQFAVVEQAESQIHETISGVAQAIGKSATRWGDTESLVLSHLHQPLSFYGINCMQAAKSCIETVSDMQKDQKVDGAAELVTEWVTLRQIRHSTQLHELAKASEAMLELHAGIHEAWQEALGMAIGHDSNSPRYDAKPAANNWTGSQRTSPRGAQGHDYLSSYRQNHNATKQPPLTHPAESKPIVPPGVRLPPEKIFENMRDYIATEPQPDIGPVPYGTPSIPISYRTSSEPYIDPFSQSPRNAWTRPNANRSRLRSSSSTPPPADGTQYPTEDVPVVIKPDVDLHRGRSSATSKPIPMHHGRDSTEQPRYPTEDVPPTKPAADRNASEQAASSVTGRSFLDRLFSPNQLAENAAATLEEPDDDASKEEETPMSRMYKERTAAWERDQAAAQQKQRDDLIEQIRLDKEQNDDFLDRRRKLRANAQSKHPGPNPRLRKPTKKQAAVPHQEEYVPPAASKPANYHADLGSNFFDNAVNNSRDVPSMPAMDRKLRSDSSPPQPAPTTAEPTEPVHPRPDSRRSSAPEVFTSSPPSSPRGSYTNRASVDTARNGDGEPLPDGWEEVSTADGRRYYYHTLSRASRWDRPTKEIAAKVAERFSASQRAVDDKIERRRKEREGELKEQEQKAQRAAELKSRIRSQVVTWSQGKHITVLLKESNNIVTFITTDSGCAALSTNSSSADVKKAYIKIIRQIHPDKLSSMTLENQILAEEVFTVLNEAFERFRSKHS